MRWIPEDFKSEAAVISNKFENDAMCEVHLNTIMVCCWKKKVTHNLEATNAGGFELFQLCGLLSCLWKKYVNFWMLWYKQNQCEENQVVSAVPVSDSEQPWYNSLWLTGLKIPIND